MQKVRQLAIPVGIATLIVTGSTALLMAIAFRISPAPSENQKEIIGAMATLLPVSAVTWWIFRKLNRSGFSSREARATTIAYAATSPFWLVLALALGEIPGSIAERFLGRIFILPVVFIGTVIVATVLSFSTCAFIVWLTQRGVQLSAEETLKS